MRSLKHWFLAMALLLTLAPLAACADRSVPGAATPTAEPTQKAEDPGLDVQPMAFKPVDSLKPAVSESLGAFSLDLFRRMTAESTRCGPSGRCCACPPWAGCCW